MNAEGRGMKKVTWFVAVITVLALVVSVMGEADGRRCRRRHRCRRRPVAPAPVPLPTNPPLIVQGSGTTTNDGLSVVTVPAQGARRVSDVDVVVEGLSNSNPDNLEVVLRKVSGPASRLMGAAGGATAVSGIELRFDDEASRSLPDADPLVGGTFKPTLGSLAITRFDGPTSLSVFDQMDPAGDWALSLTSGRYDRGNITGWKLVLTLEDGQPSTPPAPVPPVPPVPGTRETFTYQGEGGFIPDGSSGHRSLAVPSLDGRRIVEVRVNVRLTHTHPDDLNIFLIRNDAAGTRTRLMTDAGGATDVDGLGISFRDDGPAVPDDGPLGTGTVTYRPTKGEPSDPTDDRPTSLGVFRGQDPAGRWALAVFDDTTGETGQILGWTLLITVE
jgi:hypothetical protein